MEHKNLAKTNGLPLYFGLASAILLLFATILSSGITPGYTQQVLQEQGINTVVPAASLYGGMIVNYLIYPGIFLILLLVSIGKARRGKTFAIVWIVISAIEIILCISNIFSQKELIAYAQDLVPGGYYTIIALSILSCVSMLLSCVFLLKRLKEQESAPEPETNEAANQ